MERIRHGRTGAGPDMGRRAGRPTPAATLLSPYMAADAAARSARHSL
ncbi:protein of unknown function (plasmid) [Cupriavidus neocaledonicus]|uniref:Uncharacterized protein n=1 Tax=Cupriavidus neocaledonicus TaxID=1040979 RepID=A0A375HN81_9BURK|nr:hypothetical protein CBM2605_B130296 [Cupriavidus neocaledonicus]SPD59332.1 protein of unknown function [Cupriavidus neocaledonicus]SPD59357.1 protein of unknown function [Cupriavidus neocaledonicus]